MPKVSIFSIATGRYFDFWTSMIYSAIENNTDFTRFSFIVMTDKANSLPSDIEKTLGKSLKVFSCEHMEWPFPTLLRYKLITSIRNEIDSDYLMYLDADMIFVKTLSIKNIEEDLGSNDIALIKHPGFFRPSGTGRIRLYARHPRFMLRDLITIIKFGGVGTWEIDRNSTAHVPRHLRKRYACGGAWFGKTKSVLTMCDILDRNIDLDLQNGYIASFHDESHLNAYASNAKSITWLNPEYCYEPTYPNLLGLNPYLYAINKNRDFEWKR